MCVSVRVLQARSKRFVFVKTRFNVFKFSVQHSEPLSKFFTDYSIRPGRAVGPVCVCVCVRVCVCRCILY